MKVQPIASPHAAIAAQTSNQTDSRQRAIEAFNKASAPAPTAPEPRAHAPQINQNAIAPEDMSAIKAPTQVQSVEDNGQADVLDTPVEAEVQAEAKPEVKPEAKQFERLKQQERQIRIQQQKRDQQLRQREDAIKAKEDALVAKDQQYNQGYIKQDRIKQETLAVLAEMGVSNDDLIQQLLTQQPKNPVIDAQINSLKAEIQALKDIQEQSKKQNLEEKDMAYKAAVDQIRVDVKNLTKSGNDYEMIRAANAVNDVVELIEETYRKDGVLLSVEEASEEVEKYLEEEALKFTRLGKIKKKLETSNTSPQTQTPSKQVQQTQPMKTLTNTASSSRKMTARERAISAFKGELK